MVEEDALVQQMQAVLQAEADAIAAIRVTSAYPHAVRVLHATSGKIVTTGMGKAGLMARKFASTLCATGTAAVYVHPGDAAHGDAGVIARHDAVVAFSTSGKTTEVLETIATARRVGVQFVIGITSHPDSDLRHVCDLILDMGVIQEPCPVGLTPSASAAVMLAIGDAVALTLAQVKGLTRADFGRWHRAGYLGQEATR
jgi:arabinose-5-phosphate isomerase